MSSPFHEHFPNLARLLDTSDYAMFNEVGDPATLEEIAKEETLHGAPLPESYKRFLRCARSVVIADSFKTCRPFFHEAPPSAGMLCFADLGDGNQALFDLSNGLLDGEYPVFYYDHDTPSVRKIASSFEEFIEKFVCQG